MSYLRDAFDGHAWPLAPDFVNHVSAKQISTIEAMLAGGINTVQTSSCGRLFDAVASLVGLRQEANFEGQAAIELEMIADPAVEEAYPFEIAGEPWQVDFRPMVQRIVREGRPRAWVAAAFHNTIAAVIVEVCRRLRAAEGLNRVCLSGGTFQNVLVLERTLHGLRRLDFEVFLHALVPPNDGGLALGQAVVAQGMLRL